MEKYYFVYSVDALTIEGKFTTYGMILDHADLIQAVMESGKRILGVSVAMYDAGGEFIMDRDITRLLGLKTA